MNPSGYSMLVVAAGAHDCLRLAFDWLGKLQPLPLCGRAPGASSI